MASRLLFQEGTGSALKASILNFYNKISEQTAQNQVDIEELCRRIQDDFFNIVPSNYKTYCSFNSRICVYALRSLGVRAILKPCQLWHAGKDSSVVIGFLGNRPTKNKWDGHVICQAGSWFIDAAVSHFSSEFSLKVPEIIVGKCFDLPSRVIARTYISSQESLWWIDPPNESRRNPPVEPRELVEKYGTLLADRVRSTNIGSSHARNPNC